MKVHYINILLFAHALNILVNTHKKNTSITHHTQTNRSLCECELYMPNYDNDPEMKSIMENFNKQTQQRFHEYDERLQSKRMQCKEQCDKEIQKIILKDKLEKQMAQQLTTLETKITTDDIPTCVCEKSVADKVEKFCLNCGVNVGGGVTLSSGVLGGIGGLAVNAWKTTEIAAVIAAAEEFDAVAGQIFGDVAGATKVIEGLRTLGIDRLCPEIFNSFQSTRHYADVSGLPQFIHQQYQTSCSAASNKVAMCEEIGPKLGEIVVPGQDWVPAEVTIGKELSELVADAEGAAAKAAEAAKNAQLTAEITEKQTTLIDAGFESSISSLYAPIIAIEVIVLIMVIIYLILRYRRKKKMKKKLQYIKLLEE
nr:rifin PIR protein,putative [Plasmodium sp. DRC-Itaito]